MSRATFLWALAAIAGVFLVAGVTLAASRLSTQSIGISSEAVTAGERLAPVDAEPKATATPRADRRTRRRARRPARAVATPAPTAVATPVATPVAVATVDDHGGSDDDGGGDDSGGKGRGRGRGGDD